MTLEFEQNSRKTPLEVGVAWMAIHEPRQLYSAGNPGLDSKNPSVDSKNPGEKRGREGSPKLREKNKYI